MRLVLMVPRIVSMLLIVAIAVVNKWKTGLLKRQKHSVSSKGVSLTLGLLSYYVKPIANYWSYLLVTEPPPIHRECGRRHWEGACPQESFMKQNVWNKLSILAGWVIPRSNGHGPKG